MVYSRGYALGFVLHVTNSHAERRKQARRGDEGLTASLKLSLES